MIVIPAILLQGGKATAAPAAAAGISDPLAAVRAVERGGAPFVHLEDLDLRGGREPQRAVYEQLAGDLRPFQVGGANDLEAAKALLELGAERVVLGAVAFADPAATKKLIAKTPARFAVALELADGAVAGQPLADALRALGKLDARTLLLLGPEWTATQIEQVAKAAEAAILLGREGEAEALLAAAAELGERVTGLLAFPPAG